MTILRPPDSKVEWRTLKKRRWVWTPFIAPDFATDSVTVNFLIGILYIGNDQDGRPRWNEYVHRRWQWYRPWKYLAERPGIAINLGIGWLRIPRQYKSKEGKP